jgi:hypothetical protein
VDSDSQNTWPCEDKGERKFSLVAQRRLDDVITFTYDSSSAMRNGKIQISIVPYFHLLNIRKSTTCILIVVTVFY